MSDREENGPDEAPRRGRHRRPEGAGPDGPNPWFVPQDAWNPGPPPSGWQQPPPGGRPVNGRPHGVGPVDGPRADGRPPNGRSLDAHAGDGHRVNGHEINGQHVNGREFDDHQQVNGQQVNGRQVNGTPGESGAAPLVPPRLLRPAAAIPTGAAGEDAPDLLAVQSDDALLDALARGHSGGGGGGDDDRIAEMLAAWKAEVDAEPIPELVDVDTALATIMAVTGGPVDVPTTQFEAVRPEPAAGTDDGGEGVVTPMRGRRRSGKRARHLAPLAGAAALIIVAVTGVSIGAGDAQPGDTLFGVTQVLYKETAQSRQAAVDAQAGLVQVKQALAQGDTSAAAQQLTQVEQLMAKVKPEDGAPSLEANQKFLSAKLQETPAGQKADPEAPLRDGTPAPAPPTIPGKPSQPTEPSAPAGSVTPTPTPPPTSTTTQPPETTSSPTSSSAPTSGTPKPTSEGKPDPSSTTSGMGTTTTGSEPVTQPS